MPKLSRIVGYESTCLCDRYHLHRAIAGSESKKFCETRIVQQSRRTVETFSWRNCNKSPKTVVEPETLSSLMGNTRRKSSSSKTSTRSYTCTYWTMFLMDFDPWDIGALQNFCLYWNLLNPLSIFIIKISIECPNSNSFTVRTVPIFASNYRSKSPPITRVNASLSADTRTNTPLSSLTLPALAIHTWKISHDQSLRILAYPLFPREAFTNWPANCNAYSRENWFSLLPGAVAPVSRDHHGLTSSLATIATGISKAINILLLLRAKKLKLCSPLVTPGLRRKTRSKKD